MSDQDTKSTAPPTAGAVIIGDEILSGQTRDANIGYLGSWLAERGIPLAEVRVVSDEEAAIIEAVNSLRARYDHVFTTGGIGPTHDDITAAAIARAFDVPLEENAEAAALLLGGRDRDGLRDARLRMAMMPVGAQLIENPVSRAPGFRLGNVYVMAGIPAVMQAMLESIAHLLGEGAPIRSRTITAIVAESRIARPLGDIQKANGDVKIGSYPFFRPEATGTRLVLRATVPARLDEVGALVRAMLLSLGAEIRD